MNTSINRVTTAFSALLLLFSSAATFAGGGQKIDETLTTDADGRVSIDVLSGKVKIMTWDKNEVRVAGELDEEATGYQFERSGSRIVFEVEMPKQKWGKWKGDGSDLTFWIPRSNDLRFEGVNVDVTASDVFGGAKLNTVNGDINVKNLKGRINIETVNGEIEAEQLAGDIHLHTVNGKIHDKNSEGELKIEAVNGGIESTSKAKVVDISNVNGDMTLDFPQVVELELASVNGDIEFTTQTAENLEMFISTVGGSTELNLPANISARFEIEAHSGGRIVNKITDDRVVKEKYGPGRSLRFEAGSGSGTIEIGTVNGSVYLKKN